MKRFVAIALVAISTLVGCEYSEQSASLEDPIASRSLDEMDFEEESGADAAPGALYSQRAFPHGKIDLDAVKRARSQWMDAQLQRRGSVSPIWHQRGPYNIQGRVTSLAVDPTDDNTVYVGAAEGGVFKSHDAGNTWIATFDDQPAISIGALTLSPLNPNVIFAGTGEVNPGRGSVAYGGNGIYRSDDQGGSWTHIGLEDSGSIGRIVVHPTNPDIIHAAVMGHLWNESSERGVFRTTDGGATWNKVLYVDDVTGCVDIIQRPDDPNVLFAAMWTRIRYSEYFDYASEDCAVHRSDDGGLTWTLAANGLPEATEDSGRIGLAICQSNPDVMCVAYSNGTAGTFDRLYRTTDGGQNWVQTGSENLANSYRTAAAWYGNVRISPSNEDLMYVVGFDDYVSFDGGQTFDVVGGMHVDHHALAFGSELDSKIYAGNDGGVYVSDDGINFTKTTGDFPITQTYRIAQASWNTNALWLGTQDNGTSEDLDGDGDFNFIFGGDGFQPVPHLTDPNRTWVQYQYGNVFFSLGGGFNDARSGLEGRLNWNAPHAQDPNDPETRYFGSNFVFRNDGDTAWTKISDELTGGPHQNVSGQVRGTLTAIGVSPADGDVIWAGSDDGFVHVTQNGGLSWTNVSSGLPQRWVTSLRPHPTEANEALISLSGFRWGEAESQLFRTTNAGATWTSIGDLLPDMPVNDAIYDPNFAGVYFAATDIGVFRSGLNGQWDALGSNMPSVVVNDMEYQHATRKLFAGTYGRSIFEIIIPEVAPTFVDVTSGNIRGGNVTDLNANDGEDLSISRGNSVQSRVEFEIRSSSPIANPGTMTFTIDASVFSRRNVIQTVSLFDYDADQFEVIDSRNAARFSDAFVEITVSGDASRFVQPLSRKVEAKVEYVGEVARLNFTAHVDQAFWSVFE